MKNNTDAEEELYEAFRIFDKDGTGFISSEDLQQVFTNLGEVVTQEEIDSMIQDGDIDGDGRINYRQLCKMFIEEESESRSAASGVVIQRIFHDLLSKCFL